MTRFQAMTNPALDEQLDSLRQRFGLDPSQKAELLRELTVLAGWVLQQTERGRTIEARRGDAVELLSHPVLDRLREAQGQPVGSALRLTDDEVLRLADLLDKPFVPTPAMKKALANLAAPERRPPRIRWKRGG